MARTATADPDPAWERIRRGKVLLRCVCSAAREALGRPQGRRGAGHIVSPRAHLLTLTVVPESRVTLDHSPKLIGYLLGNQNPSITFCVILSNRLTHTQKPTRRRISIKFKWRRVIKTPCTGCVCVCVCACARMRCWRTVDVCFSSVARRTFQHFRVSLQRRRH